MKSEFSRAAVLVLLLGCGLSASAISLDRPLEKTEPDAASFMLTPGLFEPPSIPPEILDQFSQRNISSLSESLLVARSAELRDRIERNPGDASLLHALGTVTFHLGGEGEAQALWKAASFRDPNLAPTEVMRDVQKMFALLARGDSDGAREILRAAEEQYAREPHFQLMRGEQAMRGGNMEAAEMAYRAAFERAPDLYVTSLNLGRFYDAIGRDADAAPFYRQAAHMEPGRAEVWSFLGEFQHGQKDTEGALESLRRARSIDPSAPLPERRLGELSVLEGDYRAARTWYLAALAHESSPVEDQAIRAALGDVLLRLGLLDEARKEIEAALAAQESPPLLFALATIDEAQNNLAAAETRYRRVLALMPANPLPANNLAMLLIRTGKSPDEALRLALQARGALPNKAFVESTFGCALAHAGRNGEAVKILGPVVEAVPDDAWAHYCLGKSLLLENHSQKAETHLTRAVELDPQFPLREELEELLDRTRR